MAPSELASCSSCFPRKALAMLPRRDQPLTKRWQFRSAALSVALFLWLCRLCLPGRPPLQPVRGDTHFALASPPPASLLPAQDTAASRYTGVRWSKRKWLWELHIQDHPNQRWLHCGSFETEEEAARAYDCTQLALDQEFPDRRDAWKRNLPRETIYQDEVDELKAAYSESYY
mmetsp:Transcript_3028/g.3519  ORF Transcript_3028/g.3519 Transcript_3028/m.3519 type:complete len:173 (+) Transcript_3028:54-572(+)